MPTGRRTGPTGRRTRPAGRARRTAAASALGGVLLAGALAGCGGDGQDTGTAARTGTPRTPNASSFSGELPSALASSASAAVSSASVSASAAASSASARASEFEASVEAETQRRNAAAEKELKKVHGRGNALAEVGMTGIPRAETGGILAVRVTITNKTDSEASYAVQVDFKDADGKVVETRYAAAERLRPGKKEQPIVFSHRPPEPRLTPVLAKAQRY
ncbi:FxLYD domain-containing protein [Streptomyces achromogenes]|uniref:FxLYD domain-containing protein n=1 Tax=Streptomyces achromogenes TaxID=67255 RepID=UPI0037CFB464